MWVWGEGHVEGFDVGVAGAYVCRLDCEFGGWEDVFAFGEDALKAVGGGVFDDVVRGLLVVALAVEGMDAILVVRAAAPAGGFVFKLRDDHEEFAAEREGEDVVVQAVGSITARHGDEGEGGVCAQDA